MAMLNLRDMIAIYVTVVGGVGKVSEDANETFSRRSDFNIR